MVNLSRVMGAQVRCGLAFILPFLSLFVACDGSFLKRPSTVAFVPRGGESAADDDVVIVIDVDNCLYSEAEARANGRGVEEQIVHNSNEFCRTNYDMTDDQSQEMFLKYGSTVEGLRRKIESDGGGGDTVRENLRNYYNDVYDGIDMSCLLSHRRSSVGKGGTNTGYSHVHAAKKRQYIADLLKSCPYPLYFASNSPRGHVMKVLTALGLRGVPVEGIITPDTVDAEEGRESGHPYPTKASPEIYYRRIMDSHPNSRIYLLDDSKTNVDLAFRIGIHALHVTPDFPLEKALAEAMGHIPSSTDKKFPGGEKPLIQPYDFSDVHYLKSKNVVDAAAINPDVWHRLGQELKETVVPNLEDGILRIADVGAGLLSMLKMIIRGGGGKRSLFDQLKSIDGSFPNELKQIHYYAYESNIDLVEGCKDAMEDLGFNEVAEFVIGGRPEEIIFRGKLDGDSSKEESSAISITIHLRTKDFVEEDSRSFRTPHLVVGCCFADLFDPHELAQTLLSFTHLCKRNGGFDSQDAADPLVYFPITFTGTTQFVPAMPFAVSSGSRPVPSDTRGFQLYSESLAKNLGHNLDKERIIDAVIDHGGTLLCEGQADWLIDPTKHKYLWDTMMYFFGTCGAPEQMIAKWNSNEWLSRARELQPSIRVSNADILFRLQSFPPEISHEVQHLNESAPNSPIVAKEIQFQSPKKVGITINDWDSVNLSPNQVEVTAEASLISSGTELKIFNGMFDEAALDVNIKGMADESMAYPLAYGYSLVGRITRCGSEVKDADELLGRLVFTFSPHSSHVLVDRDSIILVPHGISAKDAIFMPSVETALSIVHDAHVRVGENVAIFGQGLIGLLVTSILSLSTPATLLSANFGKITVFDTLTDRLAMASKMGASQALSPQQASKSGPFDVAIEVSGNSRALQSAIDTTASGGRIIVGSWYGKGDVALKLGIDFHRSHKIIKASQVSTIPAELTSLWDKERRFGLTWELIKTMRPSRLLTKTVTLEEAQEAYESLEKGKNIAVSFRY